MTPKLGDKTTNTAVEALAALINVKSLVTIGLTIGFIWQACASQLNKDFLSVYLVVISFYFGTQFQRGANANNGD